MKKMMLKAVIPIIAIVIVVSCKKAEKVPDNHSNIVENTVPTPSGFINNLAFSNYAHDKLAEAVAKSLNNIEFRDWLKNEITNTDHMETDILYSKYINTQINGKTLSEILDENSSEDYEFFNNTIPQYVPSISILIPDDYYPENWETTTLVPKVESWYEDWEDNIQYDVKTYSVNGFSETRNTLLDPEEMPVIISQTDQIDYFMKNECSDENIYFENNWYKYKLTSYSLMAQEAQSETKSQSYISNRADDRDNSGKNDFLYTMRFKGTKQEVRNIKGRGKGGIELHGTYIFYDDPKSDWSKQRTGEIFISRRQAKNNSNITKEIQFIKWTDKYKQGDRWKTVWQEKDSKSEGPDKDFKIEVILKGVTIKATQPVKWWKSGNDMGENYIEFSDKANGTGTDYTLTNLVFNERI